MTGELKRKSNLSKLLRGKFPFGLSVVSGEARIQQKVAPSTRQTKTAPDTKIKKIKGCHHFK
jgi:hypothetical protein